MRTQPEPHNAGLEPECAPESTCGRGPGTTAWVDVRTTRQEISLSPKFTRGEIKSFTLYASRTISPGAGSGLVETRP
jgi:hypothetical protein